MNRFRSTTALSTASGNVSLNTIRVCKRGRLDRYVSYALTLLFQRGFDHVRLSAAGFAIRTAEKIADILLRRVPELSEYFYSQDVEMPFTERDGHRGFEIVETVDITLAYP